MIAIACDHAAFELKNELIKYLSDKGYSFKDCGCHDSQAVDYPDYALLAANLVSSGQCDKGILLCGTGIGMSIAANKVKGIRCALCSDVFSATATREHNDANMLAMGARVISCEMAKQIAERFLCTSFSNEARHINRVNKLAHIEKNN